MSPKLTPKQQLFVKEYLIDLNATKACVRAGYSKKNADKIGPELLGKNRVQEEISKAMKRREKETDITSEKILERIWEEANDFQKGTSASRVSAAVWAGKHLEMFTESHKHSGQIDHNFKRFQDIPTKDIEDLKKLIESCAKKKGIDLTAHQ